MDARAIFKDAVFKNDEMIYFDNGIQAICKMNIKTFKNRIVSAYESETILDIEGLFEFQSILIAIQRGTSNVLVYDMNEDSFEFYKNIDAELGKKVTPFCHGDEIWFFPIDIQAELFVFNIVDRRFYQKKEFKMLTEECLGNSCFDMGYFVFNSGKFAFVIPNSNEYVIYDLCKIKWEKFQICYPENLKGIYIADECVWLTTCSNSIICVRNEDEMRIEIENSDFGWIRGVGGYIVFLPRRGNKIILATRNSYTIVPIELTGVITSSRKASFYKNCREYNGDIYVFPYSAKPCYRIKTGNFQIEEINIVYNSEEYMQYKDKVYRNVYSRCSATSLETDVLNLSGYLGYIVEKNHGNYNN